MQIDGEEVPECIVAFWMSAIDIMAPQDVRTLAANRPSITQGFRPGSMNLSVARERMKAAIAKSAELPIDFREHLRGTGLSTSLLIVFSEVALEQIAVSLAEFYGPTEVASALLLDDRLDVRAIARRLLSLRDGEVQQVTRDAAGAHLISEIRPFLEHIHELLGYRESLPSDSLDSPSKFDAVEGAITSRRAHRPKREADLVIALRSKRQEVSRLARENIRLANQLKSISAERKSLESRLTKSEVDLKNTLIELDDIKSQFDLKLREALRAGLDRKLLPWLESAESLERAASALGISAPLADSSSLDATSREEAEAIKVARQLIVRQAESDRRFGIRSALRAERDQCKTLRDRLMEAQIDSIRPLADLAAGVEALETRIGQIDSVLGDDQDGALRGNLGLARLETAIAKADSLDSVSALRKILMSLASLEILSEKELEHAHALLGTASSKVYARAGASSGWSVGTEDLSGLPLYAMQACLSRAEACILIVDGHNVLWKVPSIFRAHFERGQPGPLARRALEEALLNLATRHPTLTIHIWFDSDVMEDRSLAVNLRVHFSGGEGTNRADRQMLAYLSHLNLHSSREVRTVVTADTDVAIKATDRGAMVMTPQELAMWLV
jgi:hypothetical protein